MYIYSQENSSIMYRIIYLVLFFEISVCYPAHIQGQTGKLMAGAYEAVINPPDSAYMAGYGQDRRSTGVHDNIYVKAVAVSNNENAVVFVTFDCIGLPFPVLQQIRDAVEKRIPASQFDVRHIIASSTHTHAGPDVIGIWGKDVQHSGVDNAYISFLINKAADVITNAWKHRHAVTARYAISSFGKGWVENVSDSAEIDREVTVLQLLNSRGKNIATLTNFACHPTILDGNNTLISADYPSGFYKYMKSKIGGINLFLQGAIGGWVQPEHVPRNFETAEKKGSELAQSVLTALQSSAKPIAGNDINFRSKVFEIPVRNNPLTELAYAGIIKRDIADGTLTEIAWCSIGNASFVTQPGETSPLYSLRTKQLMKNDGPKFILGLGMDELGYILKPEFFKEGTTLHAAKYLRSMSPGEQASEVMMHRIEELLK